ncbi:MAG: tetratricopeptide repeat protein [Microscillaceae bacterium]|nr:tetratricopeptide repeat protein [Microscillaceae bacterium]
MGLYIGIRLLLGHHKTPEMKDREKYREGVRLVYANRFEEARDYFTKVIEKNPQSGLAWAFRAEANYRLGNLYQCIADCSRATKIDYTLRNSYLFKGMALYDLGEYQEAIPELDMAIWQFREKHPETFRYRGLCFYALGQTQKARQDLLKAQARGDEEANYLLMHLYKKHDVL